jgi:molybdenum cofactor cytidylyltransferase
MGAPKALLEFQNETFLDRLIGLLALRCDPVVVVLGYQAEAIRAAARRAGQAAFVVNPAPALGQLSSLQCGLRAVPASAQGVLFTPVDHPAIRGATLTHLADRALALWSDPAPPRLVVPRYQGRRGHPVCCSRALIPEFLALTPESQARLVIHAHLQDTSYIDVDDPGILRDVDDPEAYRDLLRATSPQ